MNDKGDINPLHLEMQRSLRAAEAELAECEDEKRGRRGQSGNVLSLAWIVENVWHWIAMCVGFTFAFGATAWCYYLMNAYFGVGRAFAVSVAMVDAVVASHASRYFISSVETIYEGTVELDNMSFFDWKDWFWTLPLTVGVVVWSLLIGYAISLPAPEHRLVIMAATVMLTHPIFVLSTMATQSLVKPLSREVVGTLFRHPVLWLCFYIFWTGLWVTLVAFAREGIKHQPILVLSLCGSVCATILVVYALALGKMARYFQESLEDNDDD